MNHRDGSAELRGEGGSHQIKINQIQPCVSCKSLANDDNDDDDDYNDNNMWMIACVSLQPLPRLYCVLLCCLFEVVGWDQDQEEEEVDTGYSSNVRTHSHTKGLYLTAHQQADCTLMHINGNCD